mmetsp:Transcript_3487/g.7606  ORF Transcript_3487/g.7606 Transcript_3487/m.7606 type:complete len:264 (+) Transcript_3487:332-1123(+)
MSRRCWPQHVCSKRPRSSSKEAHDEVAGVLSSVTKPIGSIHGNIPYVFSCARGPLAHIGQHRISGRRDIRSGTLHGCTSFRNGTSNVNADSIADGPTGEMISQNHSADSRAGHRSHRSGTHRQLRTSAVAFLLLLHLLDSFPFLWHWHCHLLSRLRAPGHVDLNLLPWVIGIGKLDGLAGLALSHCKNNHGALRQERLLRGRQAWRRSDLSLFLGPKVLLQHLGEVVLVMLPPEAELGIRLAYKVSALQHHVLLAAVILPLPG